MIPKNRTLGGDGGSKIVKNCRTSFMDDPLRWLPKLGGDQYCLKRFISGHALFWPQLRYIWILQTSLALLIFKIDVQFSSYKVRPLLHFVAFFPDSLTVFHN